MSTTDNAEPAIDFRIEIGLKSGLMFRGWFEQFEVTKNLTGTVNSMTWTSAKNSKGIREQIIHIDPSDISYAIKVEERKRVA